MGDYFAIEALSASGAKTLLRSPAQYRYERDHPTQPTPAMVFGQLVHAVVLEPERMAAMVSTGPDLSGVLTKDGKPAANPAATAEGKALIEAWRQSNPSVQVVSAADWATAHAMAAAVRAAPLPEALAIGTVGDLLAGDCRAEVEVQWQDGATPCKAKLDAVCTLADGRVIVLDLKTTTADLDADSLGKAVATYAYHRQAAHYLAAIAAGGVVDAEFWFAFVRKDPPHEVAVVCLDQDALAKGAAEMRQAIAVYAACAKSGDWPSAQAAGWLPSTISLPRWYRGEE